MVEFRDSDDVREWLKDKPSEVTVALAARAALLVTPLLVRAVRREDDSIHEDFFLPVLRSGASAIAYSVAPEKAVAAAAAAAYAAAAAAADAAADADAYAYAAAAYAAAAAAYAAAAYAYAADAADAADAAADAMVWRELSVIATRLDDGATHSDVVTWPLWLSDDEPDWSRNHWRDLKNHFAKFPDENWQVWTDWWEDRRDGKPYNIDMEREIVLIKDEDWKRGPAHVNAMIADIRARYADEDVPADHPVAPRFETDGPRIIPRIDMPEDPASEDQAELYDALREQIIEFCALCPENSNRYGAQGKAAARFLDALGETYGTMRLTALWIGGEKLRRFERADEGRRKADDPEDEPMEPDQSALLTQIVTTYNLFSNGEVGLKAKDEKGRDPATRSPDVSQEAQGIRTAVAASPALFGEGVEPVLEGVIEGVDDPLPGIRARAVVLTRETFENLLGAIARKARTETKPDPSEFRKSAGGALGTVLVTGSAAGSVPLAMAFVAHYEATLIAFASKLPAAPVWISIITKIAAGWHAL